MYLQTQSTTWATPCCWTWQLWECHWGHQVPCWSGTGPLHPGAGPISVR